MKIVLETNTLETADLEKTESGLSVRPVFFSEKGSTEPLRLKVQDDKGKDHWLYTLEVSGKTGKLSLKARMGTPVKPLFDKEVK